MPFAPIFPTPFLTWLFFLGAIFALLAVSEWVAALAAATADTWGTEIGGWSGSGAPPQGGTSPAGSGACLGLPWLAV